MEGASFMIFIDYPTAEFKYEKDKSVISFKIIGPPQIDCRMRIVKTAKTKLPDFVVECEGERQKRKSQGTFVQGDWEYTIPGSGQIRISW